MKFEHFAINVPESQKMASWYVENIGMKITRSMENPPYTHFLSDDTGRVIMEIYSNNLDPVPDYCSQHPLRFHIAFETDDPVSFASKLKDAGTTDFRVEKPGDGSMIITMRDPWGIPLQLVKRAIPFK